MIYKANKVSGSETTLFAVSTLAEVVRQNNERNGINFPFCAITVNLDKHKYDEWIREEEFAKSSELILEKVSREGLAFFENIKDFTEQESNELFNNSKQIRLSLDSLSDEELVAHYEEFMDKYLYFYGLGAITFIYEEALSQKLTDSINKRIPESSQIVGKLLTSEYRSFMLESENMLREIKNASGTNKEDLISKYIDDFYFMLTNYRHSPILTIEKVIELSDQVEAKAETLSEVEGSTMNVELTQEEKNIIELFKITEPIRDKRKRTNVIGSYTMFRFLEELEKRKGIDREVAEKIYWFEFGDLMNATPEFIEQIKSRQIVTLIVEGKNVQYLDELAIEEENVIDDSAREIKGMTVCKGKVTGVVKIIFGHSDFGKIGVGDILVTEMTRSDFMPVLKSAAAIITDEGGLTCHAAIVAREMGKPCVIGTKFATKVFKDGDIVEVDAEKGTVKLISKGESASGKKRAES